jgi:DNA polymerase-3 subunit delta
MPVVREAELAGTLKRGATSVRGVLVHGSEEARVAGLAEQVIRSIAAAEDVTRLPAQSLRGDPAMLDDALRAQSFLGGRQLVLVADVTDAHAKLLEPVLQSSVASNFLVLTSGTLGKSSALRLLCEEATGFLVVPVYEDKPADILGFVEKRLAAEELRFSEEAADRFMALCGTDRLLALNEAEKLALYARGQGVIAADDVTACCGDQAGFGVDALIDASLSGDAMAADRMMYALDDSDWKSVLPILSAHVSRLCALRADADRLGGVEAAMRVARPPVFFARKHAFSQQLRAFDIDSLLRAQTAVEKTVEESRRFAGLSQELVSRLLLSLAAEARRGLRA